MKEEILSIASDLREGHITSNEAKKLFMDLFGNKQVHEKSTVYNVRDKLPDVECGSFLVYAPKSFPKNSRWIVAEYYDDVKGFYSEFGEYFLHDVTHWCELPSEPSGATNF